MSTHTFTTTIERMHSAPRDGTSILLLYRPRLYWGGQWRPTGTKWEQCRWISDKEKTGSAPHWEPWCGSPKVTTTAHIDDEDCLGWMKLPGVDLDELIARKQPRKS